MYIYTVISPFIPAETNFSSGYKSSKNGSKADLGGLLWGRLDGGCLAPGFSAITFSRIVDSRIWGPKENRMIKYIIEKYRTILKMRK
jgi:hypothetical protein